MLKFRLYKDLPEDLKLKYSSLKRDVFVGEAEKEVDEKVEEIDYEEEYCSQKDIIYYLIIFDGKEVIGGVELFKRRVKLLDQWLVLGGIGSLWIRRDRRRRGLATKLLKESMGVLRSKGCEVAYLCADIEKLKSLYTRVGFAPLKRDYTFVGRSGKRYFKDDGLIAPVSSKKKFKQMLEDKKPLDIGVGNW